MTQIRFNPQMPKVQKKASPPNERLQKITITCRDQDNSLKDLLAYIQKIGNIGHSFSIIVDPDDRKYIHKFGWDGDGGDYIKDIQWTK